MQSRTKTGLLLLIIGIALSMVSNILLFILGTTQTTIASLGSIGGLLFLIGILLFILGRKEFNERHRKFVIYALILWFISIIIPTVVVSVAVFQYVSQSMSGVADTDSLQNIFMIFPIASILSGLAYFFLLYELENKIGRMILFAAVFVSIITSIIVMMSIGSMIGETFESIDFVNNDPSEINALTNQISQKISSLGIYSIFTNILMLIVLFIPYQRISSGELIAKYSANQTSKPDRRCPNCGQAIPFDANICPYCSKRFDEYL